MKLIYSVATWISCTLLICCGALGQHWITNGGVPEKVRIADVIVVGKLSKIVKRDFSITFSDFRDTGKPRTIYFDRGEITNPRFLKGDRAQVDFMSNIQKCVYIAFPSRGQGGYPLGFTNELAHALGEQGVWILERDKGLTGYYFDILVNPMPLNSEDEVTIDAK